MSGGLTAAGLLVLLLALIGVIMGLYYAYICLQARPLKPKGPPKDSERGLLIPPDLNGNHEDSALEALAPEDDGNGGELIGKDVSDVKPNAPPEKPSAPLDDSIAPQDKPSAPQDASNENKDVLIAVEEDIPPANVVVERETPVENVIMPHSPPMPSRASPPVATRGPPVLIIPAPPTKKPVVMSDEEDGLLLHECVPHEDDNLEAHESTLPLPHSAPSTLPYELSPNPNEPTVNNPLQPESKPAPIDNDQPVAVVTQPETQPKAATLINPYPAAMVLAASPQHPEPNYGWKEELQPVNKAPDSVPIDVSNTPTPLPMKEEEEQLHPFIDHSNLQPITDPKLPLSDLKDDDSHNEDEGSPVAVEKETPAEPTPEDKLQPMSDAKEEAEKKPVEIVEPPMMSKDIPETMAHPLTDSKNETESAPAVSEKTPTDDVKQPEVDEPLVEQPLITQPLDKECLEKEPLAKEPKIEIPLTSEPETSTPQEETKSDSNPSLSSEEALPPYTAPPVEDFEDMGKDNQAPATENLPEEGSDKEVEVIISANPNFERSTDDPQRDQDIPATTEDPEKSLSDVPIEVGSGTSREIVDVPKEDLSDISDDVNDISDEDLIENSEAIDDIAPKLVVVDLKEDKTEPSEVLLSEPLEAQSPSDKPLESSFDSTPQAPVETSVTDSVPDVNKPVEFQPDNLPKPSSSPTSDVPIKSSDVPMEAYFVDSEGEFEGEGAPLPVITEEEASSGSESESETESSEPEVTEYSFSSGPSYLGTSVILADEVSCTLEPKMTKISAISELEGSVSGESKSSDNESEEEGDLQAPCTDNGIATLSNPEISKTETDSSSSLPESPPTKIAPENKDAPSSNNPQSPNSTNSKENSGVEKQPSGNTQEGPSDSESSDEESVGAQTEPEVREMLKAQTVVCNNVNDLPAATENCTENSKVASNPDPTCLPKDFSPIASDSEDEIASDSEDENSESGSSTSGLSDCELTTSTPKKSKIPRLVTHNQS